MVIRKEDRVWVEEEVGGRELSRSSGTASPAGNSTHSSAESNDSFHDAPGRRCSPSPVAAMSRYARLEAEREDLLRQEDPGGDEGGVRRWIELLTERDRLLRLTYCQENSNVLAVSLKRMIHMCVWVERLAVCPDPMVEQFRAALGEVIRMCPLVMKHLDSPSPHDHMERGSSPLHPSPPTPPNLQRMWVENEQGSARDATPPRQPPAALDGQGSCGQGSCGQGSSGPPKGSGTCEVPGGDQRAGSQAWSPLTPDRTDVNLADESACSGGSAQRPVSSTPELYFSPMQKQGRAAANTTSDSSQCTSRDTQDKFFSPQAEKDSTSSLLSGKDFPSNSSFSSPTLMFKFADSSEFAGLSPGKSSQDDRDDENESLFQFPKTKKSRRARRKRAGVRTASTPPRKTLQELKGGGNCARPNKRTRADDLEGDEVTRLLLASIQNLGQPSRYVALESLDEV